jgi:hypothetical protein
MITYSAGDTIGFAIDFGRSRVWFAKIIAPPQPTKLTRRSRRRHRGRTKRIWQQRSVPLDMEGRTK